MSRRRHALLAISATVAVLGLPWAIEAYRLLLGTVTWRPPAVPRIHITTGRLHP